MYLNIKISKVFNYLAYVVLTITVSSLTGCVTAESPPSFQTRQLTVIEKEALGKSLAQTLTDPGSAQFKWLPVIIPKREAPSNTPIGYCAWVNGKNLYGGYVGFKRFYAVVTRNAKGEYDQGTIQHIEGRPITFGGDSTFSEAIETGAMEGSCRAWGFIDFGIKN